MQTRVGDPYDCLPIGSRLGKAEETATIADHWRTSNSTQRRQPRDSTWRRRW